MGRRIKNMIGKKFGRLTVLERAGTTKYHAALYKCSCSCGNSIITEGRNLRKGNTSSCGCLHKEKTMERNVNRTGKNNPQYKHGGYGTRLYTIWTDMKQRCTNPHSDNYKYYGGKGIKMCKEWSDDFAIFKNWALLNGYENHLTIDRISSAGDYQPENCRWVTKAENNRNKFD